MSLWNIFSGDKKKPEKEQIEKEEYEVIAEENLALRDKPRVMRVQVEEINTNISKMKKKQKESQELTKIKTRFVNLFNANSEAPDSKDLQNALDQKKEIASRVNGLFIG